MNNRKNITILATIASVATIFAIGNCGDNSNPIDYGINTTDKTASGESTISKTKEYRIFIENELQGVKDSQGKILIPARYEKIEYLNLQQGYAVATHNDLQGAIDLEGKILLPFKYEEISLVKPNLNGTFVRTNRQGKQGLYDSDYGSFPIPQKYNRIDYVNLAAGYSIVTKNHQTGIYNLKNDRFTPLEYDEIELISLNEYTQYVTSKQLADLKVVKDKAIVLVNEKDKTRLLLQGFSSTKLMKYLIVTKNDRKGILDIDDGKPVIPIEYDAIESNFHNVDYAIVTRAGKSGILNTHNGKPVIPIEYDTIESNPDTADYAIANKANQPGILNIKDNKFIPVESDKLDSSLLNHGYVVFTQQGKEGIVNLEGKIIIPAQYSINGTRPFNNKYLNSSQNQRRGLLNLQTKKFTAFNDERISTVSNNSLVMIHDNGGNIESGYLLVFMNDEEGIIDLQGNVVVPLSESKTIEGYHDGVVLTLRKTAPGEINTSPIIPFKINGKAKTNKEINNNSRDLFIDDTAVLMVQHISARRYFCGINRQGKLLFKARYGRWGEGEKIDNLCRSLVGIKADDNANSVNKNSRHRDYNSFIHDGFIRIYVNGKYGYANAQGEIAIYPQFERAENFNEGLAAIYQDGKWGYIDQTGKIVIKPQFDYAKYFDNGVATVRKGSMRFIIDTKGKFVFSLQNLEMIYIAIKKWIART